MRLTELNPCWVGSGGQGIRSADGSPVPRREKVGVSFDCPCGVEHCLSYVPFSNPIDGGPPVGEGPHWDRNGDTFETLTLSPSLVRAAGFGGTGCRGWHGYIRNGEILTA